MTKAGVLKAHTDEALYKILVIHSYTEDLVAYSKFSNLISDKLEKKNINTDVRTFYLDSERYNEAEENARMYQFLDSIQQWNPDIILVNDDQATYTLMACNHPFGKAKPVVFFGSQLSQLPSIGATP